jgi:hypothetical protein
MLLDKTVVSQSFNRNMNGMGKIFSHFNAIEEKNESLLYANKYH